MVFEKNGKPKTILLVGAHPDDELIGPGATIAKHVMCGDIVHVIIVAEGATARYENKKSRSAAATAEVSNLQKCARDAATVLGTAEPTFLEFPDNRLDSVDLLDIVHKIEQCIQEIKPDIIYTHHGGDLNIDHKIVHRAVLTAARPLPNSCVKAIYTYETLSSTEWSSLEECSPFQPVRFVDVSASFDKKIEALSKYQSELREFPHTRSLEAIEALAKYRGATAGLAMAEAFGIIREIKD